MPSCRRGSIGRTSYWKYRKDIGLRNKRRIKEKVPVVFLNSTCYTKYKMERNDEK